MLIHDRTPMMRAACCLGVLILGVFSTATLHAQTPAASLQEAERAFADALVRHDRPAFVATFSPDAECSLPTPKRGPKAIAAAWLPFLIDPGTTMVLTTADVNVEPSGDTGTTNGTLAIRGRTNNGTQTLPVGTYVATWRLVDGRWMITKLTGSFQKRQTSDDAGGVGPFRFGMTPTAVRAVPDCQPYVDVPTTAGLECAHYHFEGHEMNISFLFAGERLRRIQLWFYEGPSETAAIDAVRRVLAYLQRKAGAAAIDGSGAQASPEAVIEMVNRAPLSANGLAQAQVSTPPNSQPEVWFSRVGRHRGGYLVMLFADARQTR
jgi:ketosteroid isomerase-like protein